MDTVQVPLVPGDLRRAHEPLKQASSEHGTKNRNSRKLSGLMLLLFYLPCVFPYLSKPFGRTL